MAVWRMQIWHFDPRARVMRSYCRCCLYLLVPSSNPTFSTFNFSNIPSSIAVIHHCFLFTIRKKDERPHTASPSAESCKTFRKEFARFRIRQSPIGETSNVAVEDGLGYGNEGRVGATRSLGGEDCGHGGGCPRRRG
jgi:hypothetical protein